MPSSMNSAPVEMPWLSIWYTAPSIPSWVKLKMPSTTKPRWLTGIGDQSLDVRLHHRHQSAVNDADNSERDNPGSVAPRLVGKESKAEAQQTVGAHLQQHACQQHRARSRCFDVRVRQPSV